jgi:hypothetical protein
MTFIALTYGYNQYSIFNTNVSTNPLLDNILTTCIDDMVHLLNAKLPIWEEQINNYNQEIDQIKKNMKKLESDKLKDDEKIPQESNKQKDMNSKEDKSPKKRIVGKPSIDISKINE